MRKPTPHQTQPARHAPVLVISHARAGRISPELAALRPLLVVAAEELRTYRDAHPEMAVAPHLQTGRGVAHARNQALAIARQDRLPALWLLDDDLFAFWRQDRAGRWCESAAHCLEEAETLARHHPARPALAGLLPAYGKPRPDAHLTPVLDEELYQCVWLDLTRLTALRYDEELPLSEDNDLCLQALTMGHHTFRPRHLGYLSPLPGTAPGGLSTTYTDPEASTRTVQRMLAKWPAHCTPTHAGHRVETHWHTLPGSLASPPEPSPRGHPARQTAAPFAVALPHCEAG